MKKDFNKVDIYILKDLYSSSKGLYPFTLYSRYDINPKEMFRFIKKYKQKEYLIYEKDKLQLTEKGKKNVFAEIFHNKHRKGINSNLPENYTGNKLDKNIPYIPIIDYLANSFHN